MPRPCPPSATSPFVGRRRELADLEQALQDVEAGEPRVVFVSGPAGIGKSRLLSQLADRIADRGMLVLRTAPVSLGADTIPLGPMTSAVRQLLDEVPRHELVSAVPAASVLPTLLPELRDPAADVPSVAEQADLFTAVLHRLGRHRPVIWIVDDVHSADASTQELIGLIARTARSTQVMVVCGHRDDTPSGADLSRMVTELARSPAVLHLGLRPFTRGETRELLSTLTGAAPDPGALDRVLRRSGGNPFYAGELAAGSGRASLPGGLQSILVHPLRDLDADTLAVVRVIAVAGPVEHDILCGATDLTEARLSAALHSALSARVIDASGTRYQVRHGLLAEAVRGAMLEVERAEIHRRCAAALSALDSTRTRPEDRTALAMHWLHSGDARAAFPALLRAAEAAGDIGAYPEQAQLLHVIIDHWEELPWDSGPVRFEDVCASASYAAAWAGRYEVVLDVVDAAFKRLPAARERHLGALLHAHRAMALHHLNRGEVQTCVQRALQLLPVEPTEARMDVLEYLAAVQTLQGRLDEALALSEEASALAGSSGDPRPVLQTAATQGWVLCELGDYERSRAVLEDARRRANGPAGDDVLQSTRLWLNLAVTAFALGDYADAITAARRGLAVREPGLARTMGLDLLLVLAAALIAVGKLTEAEATTARGLERDPAPAAAAQLHALRTEIALLTGDVAAGEREVYAAHTATGDLAVAPPAPWHLPVLRAVAEVALASNDPARAVRALAPALNPHQPGSRRDRWDVAITAGRALRAAELQGVAPALDVETLRTLVSTLPVATRQDEALAATFEAEAGDSGAWDAAAHAWRECGHVTNAAVTTLRAASARLKTNRAEARDLLTQALDLARSSGATGIAEEVRATARAAHVDLGEHAGTPGAGQLGLTQRELEVLAMIAEGSSNRQIGATLFISPKTVSVHVSNILSKLGVSNRGEAAALAHRSGLFR